ncbi:hypothetical protein C0991_012365 [Blastosporella zonata]|nr:hypothetical protein C0991_012365 [Blastosporella zonata]
MWQLEPRKHRKTGRERTASTASTASTPSSYAFVSDPDISSSFAASLESGQISDVEDISPSPVYSSPKSDERTLPPVSRRNTNAGTSRSASPGHVLSSMTSSYTTSLESLSAPRSGRLLTLHLEKELLIIWPSLIVGPAPEYLSPPVTESVLFDASIELEQQYNMDPTSLVLLGLEQFDIRKDKDEAFEYFIRAWHQAHVPTASMRLASHYLPITSTYDFEVSEKQEPRGTTAYYLQSLGGKRGLAQLYVDAGLLHLEGGAGTLLSASYSSLASLRVPPHAQVDESGTEAWMRDRSVAADYFECARLLDASLEIPALPIVEPRYHAEELEMPSMDTSASEPGSRSEGSLYTDAEMLRRRRKKEEMSLFGNPVVAEDDVDNTWYEMPPTGKSKGKGVSFSSFLDLKAEISKQEEEFARSKAAGKANYIVGGVKRPDKKPTVWARQNLGLQARASRDVELEAVSKPTLESARAALERKAKIYDKLRKGKTGGLNDKQYDELLVDFDSKPTSAQYESDSEDVDESLNVPQPPTNEEDDPIVEYEDEFGRIRTARRSEVPRSLAPAADEPDEDEDIIIRNPVNHFPVYEPSAERVAEIAKTYAEENNPLNIHYDASRENRAKGAGFYQFSGDEETRRKQMEELKAARDETGHIRQEMGAVDVLPGEVEGMQDTGNGAQSRAMEKRKRELEERRKLVVAKRRKVTGGTDTAASEQALLFPSTVPTSIALESAPPLLDALAALEAKTKYSREKGKAKAAPVSDADTFLAKLEHDFRSKGR